MDADHLEDVIELALVVKRDDIVSEEIDIDDSEDFIVVIDYGQGKKAIFREKLAGMQNWLRMQDRDGRPGHNRRDFNLWVAGDDVSYGDYASKPMVLIGDIEIKDIFWGGVIPDGFYGVGHGFVVFKRDEIGPHIGGDAFPQIRVAQFSRHNITFGCDYTIKTRRSSTMVRSFLYVGFLLTAGKKTIRYIALHL